jgi:hypothetical protein
MSCLSGALDERRLHHHPEKGILRPSASPFFETKKAVPDVEGRLKMGRL